MLYGPQPCIKSDQTRLRRNTQMPIGTSTMAHINVGMSREKSCAWGQDKNRRSESPPYATDMCTSWERPVGLSALALVLDAHESSSSDEEEAAAQQQAEKEPLQWVPLGRRQAQAKAKFEAEAAAKKMAQVVAPLIMDDISGLPCMPEQCLPMKHYNRWLDAASSRAGEKHRRNRVALIQTNKVIRALAASSSPLVFENFCAELSALAQEGKQATTFHMHTISTPDAASTPVTHVEDCTCQDLTNLANTSSRNIVSSPH